MYKSSVINLGIYLYLSSSEKKKLTQAAKTFRKGGIVAAAAVNSKKLKGTILN